MDRCLLTRWNFPISLEASEVIKANDVAGCERPLHALNPPVVASLPQDVPAVERISPALPRLAEEIRWHSRHIDWVPLLVELKEIRVSPDVGAIEVDEDCHVSNQLHAVGSAILMHRAPLLEKEELNSTSDCHLALAFPLHFFDSLRFAAPQFLWPLDPAFLLVTVPQALK